MNTVSQNSWVNTSVNSQSSKKSAVIEKFTDCPRDKTPPNKKKGTPTAKQAKRDKESKENWKNKATQRACDINIRNKTIAEIRESRDKLKKKALESASEIELLRSQVKEERQNYIGEQQKHKENQEQYLQKEAKALEAYVKLEKIVQELQATNKKVTELFTSQSNFDEKIKQLNIKIDNYTYEKLCSPDSEQTKGLSEEIGEEITEINSTLKQMEAEIKMEELEHKEQIIKIDRSLKKSVQGHLWKLYEVVICQTKGRLEGLQNVQVNLKNSLKAIQERFTNKKNRQGVFQTHEKAKKYSYSIAIIRLVLLYVLSSATSFRAAVKAMMVNSLFFDVPTPSHTIINDWSRKIGFFYIISRKKELKKAFGLLISAFKLG